MERLAAMHMQRRIVGVHELKLILTDGRFESGVEFARDVVRRLRVCVVWLLGCLTPQFFKRSAMIAILELAGAFMQAFALVAAIKIVTHISFAPDPMLAKIVDPENQAAVLAATSVIAFLISLAGVLIYKARRHAIRLAADFETERFVAAIELIRCKRREGQEIPAELETEILHQSPRFMGRMLIQLLSAIPAALTAAIALAVSFWLNFSLTAMLVAALVLLSPAFLRFTIHSSRTSRRMKEAGSEFGLAKKFFARRFLAAHHNSPGSWRSTVVGDKEYSAFLEAYQARLALAPFTQFINAMSMSIALFVIVLWFIAFQNGEVGSITKLLISLVLLRFFLRGMNILMSALAITGSFYPYFANYITLASGAETVPSPTSSGDVFDDTTEFV